MASHSSTHLYPVCMLNHTVFSALIMRCRLAVINIICEVRGAAVHSCRQLSCCLNMCNGADCSHILSIYSCCCCSVCGCLCIAPVHHSLATFSSSLGSFDGISWEWSQASRHRPQVSLPYFLLLAPDAPINKVLSSCRNRS